jgi:hypothetical protein
MPETPAPERTDEVDHDRGRATTPPPLSSQEDDTRVAFTSWDLPLIPPRSDRGA